jgi:hypothetical protein
VAAPRKFRLAWWAWQLTALALVELVVIFSLVSGSSKASRLPTARLLLR